ncbi:MAG: hypothetical protein RJQ01_07295 [Microcella sp.]|uniref:hypothetical protein n=1 Tax=Microcella sp. TaxID=1913979 RepID=UPI00331480CA
MIGALLLLGVGLGDLARRRVPGRAHAAVGASVAVAVIVASGLAIALPVALVIGAALVALTWMLALRIDDEARAPWWPVAVLLAAVSLAAWAGPWPSLASVPLDGWAAFGLDSTVVVVTAAVGVSLVTTANVVTRAILAAARGGGEGSPAQTSGWRLRLGRRTIGSIEPRTEAPAESAPSALLGGRIIGPLERLLIVFLALAGAPTLIAALLAAKGIVRFPEISADRGTGSKAEEFLIGSLTSWGLAGLGFLLIVAAQNAS